MQFFIPNYTPENYNKTSEYKLWVINHLNENEEYNNATMDIVDESSDEDYMPSTVMLLDVLDVLDVTMQN